jgi:hypothetical protein
VLCALSAQKSTSLRTPFRAVANACLCWLIHRTGARFERLNLDDANSSIHSAVSLNSGAASATDKMLAQYDAASAKRPLKLCCLVTYWA